MSDIDALRERVGRGGSILPHIDRRSLLIGGGAAAGLALAWAAWPRTATVALNANAGETVLGHYLAIGRDGHVTIYSPQAELGQGAYTLLAQVVADELGADWRTIAVAPAPFSGAYANHLLLAEDAEQATPRLLIPQDLAHFGGWRRAMLRGDALAMITGGSTGLRYYEEPMRQSAAIARAMLCMAAARRWDVDWTACDTANGFVTHGGKRLRFGELAAAAAEQSPPDYPPVRAPGAGPLEDQALPRLDLPAKIDGSMNFAADIRLPGLVYAAIRQGPMGDTRLKSYRKRRAEGITGFITAVRHERWLAAVATNSWAAARALDAMAPVFRSEGARADSSVIDTRLKAALAEADGARIAESGDVAGALAGRRVIGADYVIAPALHQPLETRSATAQASGGRAQIWVATQAPGACRAAVAAALGLSIDAVTLFPLPAGGSFGIGMEHDVAVQAALVARAIDRPVQLSWTRTEEILRDLPRAPARARMRATLSTGATIDAWHASIATPPSRHEWRARLRGDKAWDAMQASSGASDAAAVSGAVPPYRIPHMAVDHLPVDVALPAGRWRGNGDSLTAFFTESFVDELARAAGVEPLGFRMSMLGDAPDLARCLQQVTALGGWTGGEPGSGQGIACASLRGSHIAVMALARPTGIGIAVQRLVACVDVGRVVNPTIARQQIEGGLIFGLAAAVGATTRYRRGLANARRLRDIGLPILGQCPEISVEIIESSREPGGVGELAVPPVAPAIANALYTMTGRRIRRLPLSEKPLP